MPFRLFAMLFALAVAPAMAAEEVDFGAAIDQVGRLRMQSQRIVKAYCQVGLDVRKDDGARQLAEAIERFDKAMAQMEGLGTAAGATESITRLQGAWQPFRTLATGPVSRDGAERLNGLGERVLEAAHGLVLRLEEHTGRAESRLVNLSGRQRMLTQRLAKLYLLRLYGVDSRALREHGMAARKEFYAALATLQAAPENTAEINRELQAVTVQWEWLRNALLADGLRNYALGVAEASERILERMERVTALYARLARTAPF